MPTLSTFGASAGRGFGLTASGATLNSVTFTANGNWVAPTSVSNVASISGKGSNGVSDYITGLYSLIFGASPSPGPFSNPPYAQWGDLYSEYTTAIAQLNAASLPNWGPSSIIVSDIRFISPTDYWSGSPTTYNLSGVYLTSYSTSTSGSPQTSGNITYSSLSGTFTFWGGGINGYAQGNAGTASTGLGKTFPGGTYTGTYPNGTGGTAPTTIFTNVTVTPGASYPIVVPSGGSVTIQYYT